MLNDALPLLRRYLRQESDQGTTHVILERRLRPLVAELGRTRAEPARAPAAELRVGGPTGAAASSAAVSAVTPALIEVTGTTREEKLARLAHLAEEAQEPRRLGTLRPTMVFAVGNPNASIVFVGEAPGAEEERKREPFVGPAGQLLTKIITAMGLSRADVYITNICKFRPAMDDQGSGNRKPTADEMRACLPFVLAEIDIIRPAVIVALGATAAEGLGIAGSVSKNRGRLHSLKGTPVVVTYHPSFLLRQEQEGRGIEAKRHSWEDIMLAMQQAGMPVSEKQRNFFKSRMTS